jgi:hypothetical protein
MLPPTVPLRKTPDLQPRFLVTRLVRRYNNNTMAEPTVVKVTFVYVWFVRSLQFTVITLLNSH